MAAVSALPAVAAVAALTVELPAELPASVRRGDLTAWREVGRRLADAFNSVAEDSDTCDDADDECSVQEQLSVKWDHGASPTASTALPSSTAPGSVEPSEMAYGGYDSEDDDEEEAVGNSSAFRSILGARDAEAGEQVAGEVALAMPQLPLLRRRRLPSQLELDEDSEDEQEDTGAAEQEAENGEEEEEEAVDGQADRLRQISRQLANVFRAAAGDLDSDSDC